jgi:hypothetical protein
MTAPIILSLTLLLTLVQTVAPVAVKRIVANFPEVGSVAVEAQFTRELPWDHPSAVIAPPSLTFRSAGGRELKRIQFGSEEEYYTELNFVVINLPRIATPLVVAVAVKPGGSDHLFQSAILGSVDGNIRDLLPDHPTTNIQGAFCLGRFGKNSRPGVLALNFIWENGAHYSAHRYQCTFYEWTGTAFQKRSVLETNRAYESWQDAAKELGFECRWDFKGALLPNAR